MFLVVGLGNPGAKYAGNRHNVGFMAVDRMVERFHAGAMREKFKGEFTKARVGAEEVVLLKPMTYMNLSGESVQPAMRFFKVALAEVVVIHDEIDLPFGTLRVKVGGGSAGHNGLKSVTQHAGGNGFTRIRFGVGRPQGKQAVEDYVLNDFSAIERAELPGLLDLCLDATEAILARGANAAMNVFNAR